MPRRRGPDRRKGDGYHQLPIVDLVAQTDPVAQAAERELLELGQLLEFSAALTTELFDRSHDLAVTIDALETSGHCPKSLRRDSRAFFLALGLHSIARAPAIPSCSCYTSTSPDLSKDMNITGVVKGADDFCTKADVMAYLSSIGFNKADAVIAKFGLLKVKEALEYACRQPPGKVRNMGAYIRGVLHDARPLGSRHRDPDRYVKGRYGHVVQK
ncbi:MAG: hypothetical protein MUP86_03360 [Dehalococcoidia bacterium]|nr:hypothetical protein [Dehalococcoidia bacterium]